jgi:acetyl-CoA carboxylase carboxyltransferase component
LAEDKISSDEASRIARFVRLCDSFSIPVITFIDTAGFAGIQGAAKLSHAYAEATTAKLTVIVGRAYGAAYIVAAGKSAGADFVIAWPSAVILPLTPETAIHIFWKERLEGMTNPTEDRIKLAEEYAQTEGNVMNAAAAGIVTDVIAPSDTKSKLIAMLDMLSGKRVSRLPKKHSNIVL